MGEIINETHEIFSIDGIYNTYIEHIQGIHYDKSEGIQIVYIINGEVDIFISEENTTFKKGELFLINRNEIKLLYTKSTETYVLILNIFDEFLEDTNPIYCSNSFYRKLNHLYNLSDLRNKIIKIYIDSYKEKDSELIQKEITSILDILIKDYIDNSEHIKNYDDKSQYIIGIKEFIYNNNLYKANLKYISEYMYLSQSYISTLFSDLTKVSFSEFIQQYKLFIASKYLLKTNYNIEQVADIVAFNSTKSLNTIFNRYLSLTPSKFRKKYKTSNKNIYKELKSIYSTFDSLDSSGYKDLYEIRQMNNHSFSFDKEALKYDSNLMIIRNLKSLGDNYINNLRLLLKEFKVDEIFLNFKLKRNKIILPDLDREISKRELYNLINIILENNITPTFRIVFEEISIDTQTEKEAREKINENIYLLSEFYQTILDIAGLTNMRKFKYTLNVGILYKYYNDKNKLKIYKDYLILQQRVLSEKLGTTDYIWGYELGEVDEEKLEVLKEIYVNSNIEIYVPTFISLSYKSNKINKIKSIEDGRVLASELSQIIESFGRYIDSFSGQFKTIYIRDLFMNINLSTLSQDYKDLFTVILINETLFFIDSKYDYRFEYKMTDYSKPNNIYYPSIENEYGFKTPIYWIYYMASQLKGEYIYKERNLIATKEGDDIYILLFGNAIIDYFFSSKYSFNNLTKYNNIVELNIDGVNGKYKVIEERLSYEYGGVENYLMNYENFIYLNAKERSCIQKMASPKFSVDIKEYNNSIKEKIKHSPFNIILKKYIKIS